MNSSSSTALPLAIAAIIVANLLLLGRLIVKDAPFNGSSSYGELAENLVEKRIYSLDGENPSFFRPPLYPGLLALAKVTSGEQWVRTARLMQCGLSIACAILVLALARRVTRNDWASFFAVALYLLHLSLQLEHFAQRETIVFEFLALIFVFALTWSDSLGVGGVLTAAVACGGLYLTRPTGFAFLAIGVLVVPAYAGGMARKILFPLLFVAIFAATVAPWQVYNYRSFSRVTLSSSNTGGMNLYKGASPVVQSIYPQLDVDQADFYIDALLAHRALDRTVQEYEADDFLLAEAKAAIQGDPRSYAMGMLPKLVAFYSPIMIPIGKADLELRDGRLIAHDFQMHTGVLQFNYFVIASIIVPLGLFGLLFLGRGDTRAHKFRWTVLLIFAFVTALHLISFAETRFRLPLDGLLCAAAGGVIAEAFQKFRHET